MDKILHNLHCMVWHLDDILMTVQTDKEHFKNLEEVLHRIAFVNNLVNVDFSRSMLNTLDTLLTKKVYTSCGTERSSYH